jgi:hypothetical protein
MKTVKKHQIKFDAVKSVHVGISMVLYALISRLEAPSTIWSQAKNVYAVKTD